VVIRDTAQSRSKAQDAALPIKLIQCLHDPANVQQTSSKCVQNTRELLDVRWTFAGSRKHPIRDVQTNKHKDKQTAGKT